eukprot:COSAG02_NODE_2604_length_8443_cov_6.439593_12_plen_74_part_00
MYYQLLVLFIVCTCRILTLSYDLHVLYVLLGIPNVLEVGSSPCPIRRLYPADPVEVRYTSARVEDLGRTWVVV